MFRLSNLWLNCPGLPRPVAAVLGTLHFRKSSAARLRDLNEAERRKVLTWCDQQGLTLLMRDLAPEEVAERAHKNQLRLRTAEKTYRRLTDLPGEFLALKGLTQCELFGIRPEDRAQYDIDLYFPRESVEAARDALLANGYESIGGTGKLPTDHLPGLFPRTGWRWNGDYFDPEMPLAIELHVQFWNARLERLEVPGIEEFWTRRVRRTIGNTELFVLCPQDMAAYSALHLLKHVLQGSTRVFHVYELASFLERHDGDDRFWTEWRRLHAPGLRRLQAVAFALAETWFGCAMVPAVLEEIARLPEAARAWFDEFTASPVTQTFRPNKNELWLHLSLLARWRDKLSVARRRLLPANLPPPSRATESQSRHAVWVGRLASRVRHHAISLFTTLASGWRWRGRIRRM